MNKSKKKREFENKNYPKLGSLSIQELKWFRKIIKSFFKTEKSHRKTALIIPVQKIGLCDNVKWNIDGIEYSGTVYLVNEKSVHVFEKTPPYRRWKIDPELLKKI